MSLAEKLDKIRSPKLQNQREVQAVLSKAAQHPTDHKQTSVVLSAVEDTLKDQKVGNEPTAYFAALLALLTQSISSSNGLINKELATSVVYLLDLVTPYVRAPLLRSKFTQILTSLAPVLTNNDVEAPLIRSSIGCLESLLKAQDKPAWALPPNQIGPRRAIAGLLVLASDHRPKVRKRAQDAIANVLKNKPPGPSLDHPAADMCAETALRNVNELAAANGKKNGKGHKHEEQHQPSLMHALHLVKTIASASGGWPSAKIEPLCEVLMSISKSSNEYLTMAAFEIFEVIFAGMADEVSSAKLPRLMEAISELRPSHNDSQLLPPWIAVISRGYDVSAQVNSEETFQKLPELFENVSSFLSSSSHNIRTSAAECLISFLVDCVPKSAILEPSNAHKEVFEKIAKSTNALLSVKFQSAWMEVFTVLSALLLAFKWRSVGLLDEIVKIVGELRSNDSFNGKKEADAVLGRAVEVMGPENVLRLLPLNLAKPKAGQPGRAWLLPILRDHVQNTHLANFRNEFVPLSETMYQKVIDSGDAEKTMEIKIFETLVNQIWGLLPGYCNHPLDLTTAFDQTFAEMLANLLYTQTELRTDVCKALQILVESSQAAVSSEIKESDLLFEHRTTKDDAQKNLNHLSNFAGNLLAVLFNVYSQTLPQYRGYILQCINAYLSITPEKELLDTFSRVTAMLETALQEPTSQTQADKQKQKQSPLNEMPPTSHTLMDLIITLSIYLPRPSFPTLFSLAALILPQSSDPQLQKKAYKLLPRLSTSTAGALALRDRNEELQTLLLSTTSSVSAPARRDRLTALSVVVETLPETHLHFIPSILSEVVISAKEVNEKARGAAFDLLVLMAAKMSQGGQINQTKIPNMPGNAPTVTASLQEFFTMVSAGLVGSTPHMISASITALTRILYEYASQLPHGVIKDLVETMDLFLTSANREIVRSVLGFVKVAIISLPEEIITPKLATLIPGLMSWSREHKAQFRAKVKHILERAIRRFGYPAIETHCPDDDKKFINNIRKAKDRRKRHKAEDTSTQNDDKQSNKKKSRFESEYDEALYGSDSSSASSSSSSNSANHETPTTKRNRGAQTYITESTTEPLDLLDRTSLAHISSRKPHPLPSIPKKHRASKTDIDGKLIFHDDDSSGDGDDDAMALDFDEGEEGMSLEGGINAYVDAIRSRDAVKRGRGGRLRVGNVKGGGGEMDVDDDDDGGSKAKGEGKKKGVRFVEGGGKGKGRGGGGRRETAERGGKGVGRRVERRGLGAVKGGRVGKGGSRGRR
ncbi:pre-rRNA processing protein [Lecanora helva]